MVQACVQKLIEPVFAGYRLTTELVADTVQTLQTQLQGRPIEYSVPFRPRHDDESIAYHCQVPYQQAYSALPNKTWLLFVNTYLLYCSHTIHAFFDPLFLDCHAIGNDLPVDRDELGSVTLNRTCAHSTSAWCQLGNGLRIVNGGSGQWKRLRSMMGQALDDDESQRQQLLALRHQAQAYIALNM